MLAHGIAAHVQPRYWRCAPPVQHCSQKYDVTSHGAAGLLPRGGLGFSRGHALLPGPQRQRQCAGSQLRPLDAAGNNLLPQDCPSTATLFVIDVVPAFTPRWIFCCYQTERPLQETLLIHSICCLLHQCTKYHFTADGRLRNLQGPHKSAGCVQRGAAARAALLCLPVHLLWHDGQPRHRH